MITRNLTNSAWILVLCCLAVDWWFDVVGLSVLAAIVAFRLGMTS